MAVAVRNAQAGDLEFIIDCNARLAQETEDRRLDPHILRAGVKRLLDADAEGRYFIAELEGQRAGQMMLTHEWSDWRNGYFWWIQSVYVVASARRHGVFASLFHHVEQLARATEDVCGLRLYVDRDNHAAQETYQRLGLARTAYEVMELEFRGRKSQGGS